MGNTVGKRCFGQINDVLIDRNSECELLQVMKKKEPPVRYP
jgi:hypothetical protein